MSFSLGKSFGKFQAALLLFLANIFIFFPFQIYHANSIEFEVTFSQILRGSLSYLLGAWLLISFLGIIFSKKQNQAIVFLLALSFLTWVQGFFLYANYGIIGDENLNLAAHNWRSLYEIPIWIGVLILAFKSVTRLLPLFRDLIVISFVAQVLLCTVLLLEGIRPPKSVVAQKPELYEFSKTKNVFFLVLDSYQSEYFIESMQNKPDYQEKLRGVTFYRNTIANFPYTRMAVPALLSGEIYDNKTTMWKYLNNGVGTKSLPRYFQSKNFRSEVVLSTDEAFICRKTSGFCGARARSDSPTPSDKRNREASQLLDFVFFKHFPHLLKFSIYNKGLWFLDYFALTFKKTSDYTSIEAMGFFKSYIQKMHTTDDKPGIDGNFKYFHLNFPHNPVATSAECEPLSTQDPTSLGFGEQMKCASKLVLAFLDRLRELGIYDSSAIVIASDHGISYPKSGGSLNFATKHMLARALPVLLIKAPASSANFRISQAPAQLADIPATLADMVYQDQKTFSGSSLLRMKENQSRIRSFNYFIGAGQSKKEYLNAMFQYKVEGDALEVASWVFEDTVMPPSHYDGERVQFGTRIHLSTAKQEEIPWGWYWKVEFKKKSFRWLWNHQSTLNLGPIENSTTLNVVLSVPQDIGAQQSIELSLNGQLLKSISGFDGSWQEFKISIPPNMVNATPNRLDIKPSHSSEIERDGQKLKVGARIRSIGFH